MPLRPLAKDFCAIEPFNPLLVVPLPGRGPFGVAVIAGRLDDPPCRSVRDCKSDVTDEEDVSQENSAEENSTETEDNEDGNENAADEETISTASGS